MFVSASTKDEERKALAKIRDIIASVGGENSYIGAAIDYSVLNLANSNIDNDFMVTPTEQIEEVRNEAAAAKQDAANVRTMMERLQDEMRSKDDQIANLATACKEWEKQTEEQDARIAELREDINKEYLAKVDAMKRATAAEKEIQKLKAMLFDYMMKGEKNDAR